MEDADEPPQRAADEQPPEPEVMTISDDGVKDEDAGIPTPEGNWTDDSEDIDDVGLQKALLAELAGGENMEVEDPFQSLCDDMPPACESSAGGSVGDAPAKHASRVAVAMAILPHAGGSLTHSPFCEQVARVRRRAPGARAGREARACCRHHSLRVCEIFALRSQNEIETSFWVADTMVLQSQNEAQSLWSILSLGWRNLGSAFPERHAKPMVRIHSGLAKPRFCIPRTTCEAYGSHSFWVGET
jgi:hypothetical protein